MKKSNHTSIDQGQTTDKGMGVASLKQNSLRGMVLAAMLAIPGVAEAGTARTDLPTCEEAKMLLQKDNRQKVEEWATQVCLCSDTGSLGKKVKNNILTQSQYDDKCGTGMLSKNAPKTAVVPQQKPAVPTPYIPKPIVANKQNPPSNGDKGKADGGTPEVVKTDEGITGSESTNAVPEVPKEAIWAMLSILGVAAWEAYFRMANKRLRRFIKKAQEANEVLALSQDKAYMRKKPEENGLPIIGTTKAYLTNKNLYEIEVAENKKL